MPVQCLIRKLSQIQVEKAINDQGLQERLIIEDHNGTILLIVNSGEASDPEAHAALQKLADADAAIMQKDRAAAEAAEAKKLAEKKPKP